MFMSQSDVAKAVGLSRQELWRRRQRGEFPQPVKLGIRRVGYLKTEIDAWCAARVAARDSIHQSKEE